MVFKHFSTPQMPFFMASFKAIIAGDESTCQYGTCTVNSPSQNLTALFNHFCCSCYHETILYSFCTIWCSPARLNRGDYRTGRTNGIVEVYVPQKDPYANSWFTVCADTFTDKEAGNQQLNKNTYNLPNCLPVKKFALKYKKKISQNERKSPGHVFSNNLNVVFVLSENLKFQITDYLINNLSWKCAVALMKSRGFYYIELFFKDIGFWLFTAIWKITKISDLN